MNLRALAKSRWVSLPLKIAVTALAVYFLSTRIQFREILAHLGRTNPAFFFSGLALSFVGIILQSYRWKTVMGIREIPLGKFLYFVFIGYFFNLFLPTAFGGEALKILYFGRKYGYTQESFGVNILVKVAGMIIMYLMGITGFICYRHQLARLGLLENLRVNSSKVWLLGLGMVVLIGIGIALWKNLAGQKWVATMIAILKDKTLLAKALGLTFLIQVTMILSVYLLFLSVYREVSLWVVAGFLPIVFTLLALPISFGGVGVREYLNTVLFSDLGGIPAEAVVSATVLGYAYNLAPALIGGLWFLFRKYRVPAGSEP